MSLVLNMVGGGSGGFNPSNALIHVNAPLGSTVSFEKDSIIAKTVLPEKAFANIDGRTADYYYSVKSINYGEWTAIATLGTDVTSNTITINTAKQYDIELLYKFYIFRSGYGFVNGFQTVNAGAFTRNDNYLQWSSNVNGFATTPIIDTSIYDQLCCDLEATSVDSDTYKPTFGLSTNTTMATNSGSSVSFVVKKMCGKMSRGVVSLDITGYNSSYYFKFTEYYFRGKIYNIWFE